MNAPQIRDREVPRWLHPAMPAAVVALFSAIVLAAYGEDLGDRGQTYVPDADARDQFKEALRRKQVDGELGRFWERYRDQTLEAIRHPAPLPVRTSYESSIETHAVAFTMPTDFLDQNGKVVARRGQVIEPLAISPLTDELLLIDGRDAAQVQWAVARGGVKSVKIVLIAGSPVELRQRYAATSWRGAVGVPFYFDQRAMIINSLATLYQIRLRSVPAEVSQEGSGLRIAYGLEPKR